MDRGSRWTIRSVRSRRRRRSSLPERRTTRRCKPPGRRGRGPPIAPRELRAALQSAIQAGDDGEIARLKQAVGAVLAEHRTLTDEFNRLKAERPDWKTPPRPG